MWRPRDSACSVTDASTGGKYLERLKSSLASCSERCLQHEVEPGKERYLENSDFGRDHRKVSLVREHRMTLC